MPFFSQLKPGLIFGVPIACAVVLWALVQVLNMLPPTPQPASATTTTAPAQGPAEQSAPAVTAPAAPAEVPAQQPAPPAATAPAEVPAQQPPATPPAVQQSQIEAAQPVSLKPGTEFKDCTECPTMVVVPAGSFTMGSPASETGRESDEGPEHQVTIAYAFAVGKFEVTFTEWAACRSDGGCDGYDPPDSGWGKNNRPVIHVSWNDAQAYLTWLSRKTGKQYRLLSESEWEYAARAGTTTPFYWGETASHDSANYGNDVCCMGLAKDTDKWENTSPVGSFPPNAFALYDMLGNVWEWTTDCENKSYEGAPNDGAAWSTGDCSQHVLRGGSWFSDPSFARSAIRDYDGAGDRNYDGGFRVARIF